MSVESSGSASQPDESSPSNSSVQSSAESLTDATASTNNPASTASGAYLGSSTGSTAAPDLTDIPSSESPTGNSLLINSTTSTESSSTSSSSISTSSPTVTIISVTTSGSSSADATTNAPPMGDTTVISSEDLTTAFPEDTTVPPSGETTASPSPTSTSAAVFGTLDPSGTEATSRADAIKTSLDNIIPILESYTSNPDEPKATAAIEAIESIQPEVEDLFSDLDPKNEEEEECGGDDPIALLFNAVKCTVSGLEDAVEGIQREIESGFEDMSGTEGIVAIPGIIGGAITGTPPGPPSGGSGGQADGEGEGEQDADNDDEDEEDEDEDQSSTSTSASSTASSSVSSSSSSSSCSVSALTTSVCDTICVTPTSASASTYAASASLTTQSCTTTCDETTITHGCSSTASLEEPESTTSTLTISADACPLTSSSEGPWTTAWFDDSVSCAGVGCSGLDSMPAGPDYGSFLASMTSMSASPSSTDSSASSSSMSANLTSSQSATTTDDSSSSITSAPASSVTPGCAIIYPVRDGGVGMDEYTSCLCDGTTASISTAVDDSTSYLASPTTSGEHITLRTMSPTANPSSTTTSSAAPQETFPQEEVDEPIRYCGAYGNYSSPQGGGAIEAGAGLALQSAESLVYEFCLQDETLSTTNPLLWQAYQDAQGRVFWVQAEVVAQECDVELRLGGSVLAAVDQCLEPLDAVLNSCDTDTTAAKVGGRLQEGCVVWTALNVGNWDGPEPRDMNALLYGPENDGDGEEDDDSGGEGEEPEEEEEEEEEEEPPQVDENSPEYKRCISNMGASDCSAADAQCLVDQCNGDEDCRPANLDYGVYA